MAIPANVKCPICGSGMSRVQPEESKDFVPSSLSFRVRNERRFARTAIFLCAKCQNIQSFIEWEERQAQ
jgi:endogenous inhibitor of DNA gyrase (YacG/DUF329 family)